jgi:hypothetical protein
MRAAHTSSDRQKLLALYGLKFDSLSSDAPTKALYWSPNIENFCSRIVQPRRHEGGFVLISSDPFCDKSAVPRLLAERLALLTGLSVGVVHQPQAIS